MFAGCAAERQWILGAICGASLACVHYFLCIGNRAIGHRVGPDGTIPAADDGITIFAAVVDMDWWRYWNGSGHCFLIFCSEDWLVSLVCCSDHGAGDCFADIGSDGLDGKSSSARQRFADHGRHVIDRWYILHCQIKIDRNASTGNERCSRILGVARPVRIGAS